MRNSIRQRSCRWTFRDGVALGVLLTLIVTLICAAWWTSDVRTSHLRHYGDAQTGPAITAPPAGWQVAWRHYSPLTAIPDRHTSLVAGTAVITATSQEVVARDPLTGNPVWSYQRNRPLCAVDTGWGRVISVWQDRAGCGDVVTIEGHNGQYGPTRSGEGEMPRRILTGSRYVMSYSSRTLETWRSDMVRTSHIGYTETPLQPGHKARAVCHIVDAEQAETTVGIVQACPGQADYNLAFYAANPKEDVEPEQRGKVALPYTVSTATQPRIDLIELTDDAAVLYMGVPYPHLMWVNRATGEITRTHTLDRPATQLNAPIMRTDKSFYWWNGRDLYAFSSKSLDLKWSRKGATGTPAIISTMVGSPYWLVVPVQGGLQLCDGGTGDPDPDSPLISLPGPAITSARYFSGMLVAQQGSEVVGILPHK